MPALDLTRIRFEVGPAEVVATADQRRAAGLHHWVDGTLGIDRTVAGAPLVIAPNGPHLARHRLGPDGLVAGLEVAEQEILGLADGIDHASGGPLHRDPETGTLLLVYHGERFANGDPADYWSFLGLAASHDDGRTFHDLGPILTSPSGEGDDGRHRPVEVGPGGFVVRDGWWHLYFLDRANVSATLHLGVARASVDDVRAAVAAGRAPRFAKYRDGAFAEPGLGGGAGELLPAVDGRPLWFDVAWIPAVGATLLVYATAARGPDGRPHWYHRARLSVDGVAWGEPVDLGPEAVGGERLYVTVDSGGADQRRIDGDGFDLYRVVSDGGGYRWDDARLERVPVRISGSG
jgi:hypothetical protein